MASVASLSGEKHWARGEGRGLIVVICVYEDVEATLQSECVQGCGSPHRLRQAMFRREVEARVIAVNGLVKLLFIALKVIDRHMRMLCIC